MSDYRRESANGDETNSNQSIIDENFEDVVLIVEGKRIKANSGILAFSSPVFATWLRGSGTQCSKVWEPERHINVRLPTSRYEFRSESSKAVQTRIGEPLYELVIPNYKYKDVKKILSYLVDKNGKRLMSGETAWRLLPIAEEYKMKSVKTKCGDALLKSLLSMRDENQPGSISTKDALKYLACAEKYGFSKMKTACIDECAANYSVTRRKDVACDKHVQEMTKVKIMEQMCENMSADYETRLEQIKAVNDSRYTEVNRKLQQQKEITDNWKEDLKQEVGAVLGEAQMAHNKLAKKLEKLGTIAAIEEQVSQLSEEVIYEVGQVKDQVQAVVESLAGMKKKDAIVVERIAGTTEKVIVDDTEKVDDHFAEEVKSLIQTYKETLETSAEHFDEMAGRFESQIATHLRRCNLDNIETSLGNNFELQDSFDRLTTENIAKQKALSDAELMVEKEQQTHEKTRAELQKYTKKVSKMNTWIKWATPIEEDEDKCLCFRHVSLRSSRQ